MTGLALPAALSAALSSIRWPLSPSSCPPLYFESLDNMKAIREKSSISTPLDAMLSDLPESLASLFPSENKEKRHFGLISMALLFLGHGLTDESHDIVTPLSWPEDTHFGYGPSVYSQVSPAAQSYATYVHCLVHRREAFNVGEFGMVGFSNANYWSNAVLNSPGVDCLPHKDLVKEIGQLARQSDSIPGVKEWYERHDLLLKEKEEKPFFESRAVHELCANVLREKNPDLQDFAERVAETELRILLRHALQNSGYDCELSTLLRRDKIERKEGGGSIQLPPVDESAALSAARRVSSAHLNMFQSNGFVTIRSVLNIDVSPGSAAVGVACRLLESPACRPSLSPDEGTIRILLPSTPEEAAETESMKVSLSPGDLYAVNLERDEVCSNGPWYTFAACDPTDKRACYVDPLFGKRGETPTTVVQWSKGTIFYLHQLVLKLLSVYPYDRGQD